MSRQTQIRADAVHWVEIRLDGSDVARISPVKSAGGISGPGLAASALQLLASGSFRLEPYKFEGLGPGEHLVEVYFLADEADVVALSSVGPSSHLRGIAQQALWNQMSNRITNHALTEIRGRAEATIKQAIGMAAKAAGEDLARLSKAKIARVGCDKEADPDD